MEEKVDCMTLHLISNLLLVADNGDKSVHYNVLKVVNKTY